MIATLKGTDCIMYQRVQINLHTPRQVLSLHIKLRMRVYVPMGAYKLHEGAILNLSNWLNEPFLLGLVSNSRVGKKFELHVSLSVEWLVSFTGTFELELRTERDTISDDDYKKLTKAARRYQGTKRNSKKNLRLNCHNISRRLREIVSYSFLLISIPYKWLVVSLNSLHYCTLECCLPFPLVPSMTLLHPRVKISVGGTLL